MEVRTCSACGYGNLPGEEFCRNCGVQLAPVVSSPPPLPSLISSSSLPTPSVPAIEQKGTISPLGGHFILQDTQQSILLPPGKAEVVIGRSDPADEYFPDVDLTIYGGETAGVSRRHARLSIKEGKPYIEDLNSTNFTFINQQTLLPGKHYPLRSGDVIQLGRLSLIFVSEYE